MQLSMLPETKTVYCPDCQTPYEYDKGSRHFTDLITCSKCGYEDNLYTWPFYLWRDRDKIIREYVR